MSTINREQLIAEQILRKYVRKKLIERRELVEKQESAVRGFVRQILREIETDETSTRSTGINVLADLLKKIIPILEDSYMMLTTSQEQRNSFRNHIVAAAKNALVPVDANKEAANENVEYDLSELLEKVEVSFDGDDGEEESVSGDFIDIKPADEEEDVMDVFGIAGEDATGRNFAHYEMLADPEDKNVFREFLLTNLMLYFDRFEDALAVDPGEETTPEYEKEKADADAETDPVDDEEGADEEEAPEDEETEDEPPPA